jgi:hypothetical protein
MLIIGCDFHTRYQQIALMDEALPPSRSAPRTPTVPPCSAAARVLLRGACGDSPPR